MKGSWNVFFIIKFANPERILERSWDRSHQFLHVSAVNPDRILLNSWPHTSFRNQTFPQEKNSVSVQDPRQFLQGSSTEVSKILPREYIFKFDRMKNIFMNLILIRVPVNIGEHLFKCFSFILFMELNTKSSFRSDLNQPRRHFLVYVDEKAFYIFVEFDQQTLTYYEQTDGLQFYERSSLQNSFFFSFKW